MPRDPHAPLKVAVIAGDGIGKEVMPQGLACLRAAAKRYGLNLQLDDFGDWASCDLYLSSGHMLPPDWKAKLSGYDAIYFGAVVPARVRPIRQSPSVPADAGGQVSSGRSEAWRHRFLGGPREHRGEYSSIGGKIFEGTERETVIQETVMTRIGVDRVLQYAFDLAERRPKKHLTSATKSNGISITMPYWDTRVAEAAKRYPNVNVDKFHIDILTAHFVLRPQHFDVVVASNLFGDILSDLGPACTGTIGIAASANINPEGKFPSLFEPVHGSAPDIYGKGIANPVGMIWAGQMMLEHFGYKEAADGMLSAIEKALGTGGDGLTPDMGGKGSTESFGTRIVELIERA
ncbi:hypothetical protein EHS25_004222 [Saitozyma podzolica]|uniref:Isopropylmalate dehydrogenase-like domain-containing protein n=1 Tax=Saitozyma podzolica TaxID=1890683 RepID=A0A427YTN2_9TREE|nr:hypothetical protein EHS25_004222 [Saitozyma podzolica]